MLESFNIHNEMQYQKLSLDEQQERGILGRLVGIIADFKNPTRNGRLYTEELWDKTFENPLMKEKIENRCLFGELGHPEDRQEINMEKIAICLAESPKKGNDGKLYGVFDILDTPNGRILKTMCDYGCKIGVSSRGSGDTIEDFDGNETVEPDSYECECWDAVLLPAVKTARPQYVTESVQNKKTLKKALQEALDRSTEDEKKVMEQTLNELEIDYSTEQDDSSETVDNIDIVTEKDEGAADNDGAEVLQELQEALKTQRELEKQVKSLQEKLSVCYTKEARYSEVLSRTKNDLAQSLKVNQTLSEQLKTANSSLNERNETVKGQKRKIEVLQEQLNEGRGRRQMLSESVAGKENQIKTLQEQINSLKSVHKKKYAELEEKNKQLTESLEEGKKDSQIVKTQASAKVQQAQALVEKYKNIARTAVDRYISYQAKRLGVNSNEIKNRLNESYSFSDIDKVCENLQRYKLTVNSLPFNVSSNKEPVKMTIKESKEVIGSNNDRTDDEIDAILANFV